MRTRLAVALAICLFVFGVAQSRSHAADSSSPRKLRMAFTSLSGSMIPPWMARSAGIFAKHGLDVEVIATPSGVEGMNALIAGEVQFLQIAGSTTASAALGGADVMIVGTTIDTLVQHLMVRPEIEKPEQLKGKSLGISRFGTSIDTGARIAEEGLAGEIEVHGHGVSRGGRRPARTSDSNADREPGRRERHHTCVSNQTDPDGCDAALHRCIGGPAPSMYSIPRPRSGFSDRRP